MARTKTTRQPPLEVYRRKLRDHLAIIAKAVDTIQFELPRLASYPQLQSRMDLDLILARSHMQQVESLLVCHGAEVPFAIETVSSVLSNVSSLLPASDDNDVLNNALAAAGYKAHQIASYDALIVLAGHLEFQEDVQILICLRDEEFQSAEWLSGNIRLIVERYLDCCA